MKKENGSLVIEASIAMVTFLFMFLAFLTIARYNTYQNRVKHALDQTAVQMSARNFTLSEMQVVASAFTGVPPSEIAKNVGKISKLAENTITGIGEQGGGRNVPYTDAAWTRDELQREVLRMFTSQYLDDLTFEETAGKTNTDLINELTENGITINLDKEEGIYGENQTGGGGGIGGTEFISESKSGNHSELTITIDYEIDTGLSFHGFFGIDTDPKFKDSVKITLME